MTKTEKFIIVLVALAGALATVGFFLLIHNQGVQQDREYDRNCATVARLAHADDHTRDSYYCFVTKDGKITKVNL